MALPTRIQRFAYAPFEMAQREFDQLLGQFLGARSADSVADNTLAHYGVDVREDADHIYVEAELPGFRKDDVNITLEKNMLTIAAERSREERYPQQPQADVAQGKTQVQQKQSTAVESHPQGDYLLRERRYSRFQRSFTLPPTVDEQTVNAKLNDGMLTITLNKREETKPRKVQVS